MQGRFFTKPTREYRSVFISGCMLGTHNAHAAALLDTLISLECDTLFLVGDIIHGTQLKKAWTWQPIHSHILNALIRLSDKGTKIIYIPGDHDADIAGAFPRFMKWAARRNRFTFKRAHIHTLADGRQMAVRYGRMFRKPQPDHTQPIFRRALQQFQNRILKRNIYDPAHYAVRHDIDGIITAQSVHNHIRTYDGITLSDCGRWDSDDAPTFLVEHHDGTLAHIAGSDMCSQTLALPTMDYHAHAPVIAMTDDVQAYSAVTEQIMTYMKTAWCPANHSIAAHFAGTWPKQCVWGRVNAV